MKRILCLALFAILCLSAFAGCAEKADNHVTIYSCASQTRIAHIQETLSEKFPDYEISVESLGTGKLTSKLLQEGANTEIDIIHDLAYLSLDKLDAESLLADLSGYDTSVYVDGAVVKNTYLPEMRTGGGVIVNTKVLTEKNLQKPTSYDDLLKPEYKGLVSMPNPNSSGTGYMFYKSIVNARGEEKAIEYFDALAENVLQFTESGNGPVQAVAKEEAAIGLGMISDAAIQMSDGVPLEILFFEEGAPYTTYGQAMVRGKETRAAVKEVFDYLSGDYNVLSCQLWAPEKMYKEHDFELENFPKDIQYADMSGDTAAEKERLLKLWPIA